MARWIGSEPPPFTGTKHGVTVYQLQDDTWFVRQQSSITGKRIKKDKAFARFRESSGRMAKASKMAAAVYKQLAVRKYALYREMTGKAILWLKEGVCEKLITERLAQEYLAPKECAAKERLGNGKYRVKQGLTRVKALFRIPVDIDIRKRHIYKTKYLADP
jgi:hypothetical protein